jgi:hypothetical protein
MIHAPLDRPQRLTTAARSGLTTVVAIAALDRPSAMSESRSRRTPESFSGLGQP